MSHVFRVAARTMANVTSSYVAGTHSMAFVTVPDDQVAHKLAKYVDLGAELLMCFVCKICWLA